MTVLLRLTIVFTLCGKLSVLMSSNGSRLSHSLLFLFYYFFKLSDVDAGGATVFLHMDEYVFPRKVRFCS